MDLSRIDHVGVAVDDEHSARAVLEDLLGCPTPKEELVEEQGVRTLIYPLGDTKIELLIPTREDSPVAKHLEKRGEGLHHLALEVDDLPEAIDELENSGLDLIDHEPRPGVEGSEIAFVHPGETFGTLLELVQFPHGRPGES